MKPGLRVMLKAAKKDLREAPPKSRDRLRHRVRVLERAPEIKREAKAA